MLQIADRVKETTTTTGTGAVTLAGAATGFRAFSTVCADQDTAWYALQAVDTNGLPTGDWEVGVGTYNTSGNTLSRTTILASSNSNAAVSLAAGTKQVWIGQPAERVVIAPPGEPDTHPVLAGMTWVNQSLAVATQREGYISLVDNAEATTGGIIRLLTAPTPGAPYALTVRMRGLQLNSGQGSGCVLYDSVSGQALTLGPLGGNLRVSTYTSPTAFGSALFVTSTNLVPEWLRLRNDGTSLFADVSMDGFSFMTLWSGALSTLPNAPDQAGVFLYQDGSQVQASLNSFKVG